MSDNSKQEVDASQQFKSKLQDRTAKVGIIGLGYVGLPLALLFNEENFPVTGFDIDSKKVDTLNLGGSYIYRIPPTPGTLKTTYLRRPCLLLFNGRQARAHRRSAARGTQGFDVYT
jgi:hypothetical protein